jgi:RNA ligase (TIGR02306 family)
MSDLIVEVSTIDEINPHSNADRLDLAIVKGWQTVVPKDRFSAGDTVVYVPIDAVLPIELSDELGVTGYLNKQRVRAARLRGEMSFGFVFPPSDLEGYNGALSCAEIGDDVAEVLNITKWEPPIRMTNTGKQTYEHPLLFRYTDIQNIKNFPDIFIEGEEVVVTEKIHGTNSRLAIIRDDKELTYVAGSHKTQRDEDPDCLYWKPMNDKIREMLMEIHRDHDASSVILYGEIFGQNIQDLTYGRQGIDYRAFDIKADGKYLDYEEFIYWCSLFSVPVVPVLYVGPFSKERLLALTVGDTTLEEGKHIREGIVVKAKEERLHPRLGRTILKSISDDYLMRKNATEFH